MIIADTKAPRGLATMADALRITLEEWESMRSIELPEASRRLCAAADYNTGDWGARVGSSLQ
jgi:hypothetical protein